MVHVKVLLYTIPVRYDLPLWSCVNDEIRSVNDKIVNLQKHFKNLTVVDIGKIGRRFHTAHALHLNVLGKLLVSDDILHWSVLLNNDVKEVINPWP